VKIQLALDGNVNRVISHRKRTMKNAQGTAARCASCSFWHVHQAFHGCV
jgi:hypothetical protein